MLWPSATTANVDVALKSGRARPKDLGILDKSPGRLIVPRRVKSTLYPECRYARHHVARFADHGLAVTRLTPPEPLLTFLWRSRSRADARPAGPSGQGRAL